MTIAYARVSTYGKGLAQIEEETVRAADAGSRVLVNTTEGAGDGVGEDSPSRNTAIAAWAEAFCREHGMTWRRVGRDVLFSGPSDSF